MAGRWGGEGAHRSHAVDHRGLAVRVGGVAGARLLGDKRPQLVHVDHGAEELVLGLVEVPHANLTEVTRVAAHGEAESVRPQRPQATEGGGGRMQRSGRTRKPRLPRLPPPPSPAFCTRASCTRASVSRPLLCDGKAAANLRAPSAVPSARPSVSCLASPTPARCPRPAVGQRRRAGQLRIGTAGVRRRRRTIYRT